MLKVLQLSDNNIRGGIFRVVADLDNSFLYDSDVDLHTVSVNTASEFNKIIKKCYYVPSGFFKKMIFLLKSLNKFDILHFHGFNLSFFVASIFCSSKIVFTNHGLLGTGRKLKKYEHIKKLFLKTYLKYYSDLIINVSEYAGKRLIEEYKIKPDKTRVVHNCTAWEKRALKEFSSKDTLIIGFHGRFVKFKRIDRLFKVASIIQDRYKKNVSVVLIGEGPLKKDYKINSVETDINLEVIDYTLYPQNEITKFDFLIIPSDEEYFGLSVLEGILSGVITFVFEDGGGCTEIFDEEHKWFICKNEVEMAEKLIHCLNNFEEISKLFYLLQLNVQKRFSPEHFYSEYKNAYVEVINR